jgi:Bacterial Ig-like domain (group 1)
VAGTKKTFSVTGRDAYGNSVPLATATWAVSVGTPGSVSPASGLSTVFTASTTPGSGSVVATSGALTASASVTVAPTAVVSSISYVRQGADLLVTLAVTDAAGMPIAGASTTFSIARSGVAYTSASATTGGDGRATATLFGAPAGCYTTTVTGVTATGYVWDKKTPANQICL